MLAVLASACLSTGLVAVAPALKFTGAVWYAVILIASICPLVISSSASSMLQRQSVSWFVSFPHAVFFGFGGLWFGAHQDTAFPRLGEISPVEVLNVVLAASLLSTVLVTSIEFGRGIRSEPLRDDDARSAAALRSTAVALFGAATLGAAIAILSFGGLSGARAALLLHAKGSIAQTGVGGTLWGMFALPAVLVAWCGARGAGRATWRSASSLAAIGIVLFVGVYVFGSRLLLVLTAIGILAMHLRSEFRWPKIRHIAVFALSGLVISTAVLAVRASVSGNTSGSVAQSITYSVLDATTSALRSPELPVQFGDAGRVSTGLAVAVPGPWTDGQTVHDARVDVMVVRAIGNPAQAASSGIPISLPGFLLVYPGFVAAAPIVLVVGYVIGRVDRRFYRRVAGRWLPLYGLWACGVFTVFKDGDILLGVGAELRRTAYIAGLISVCSAISGRRKGIGTESSRSGADKEGLRHSQVDLNAMGVGLETIVKGVRARTASADG